MTELEAYLLKIIPNMPDEELRAVPDQIAQAIAENAGGLGVFAIAARLWKRLKQQTVEDSTAN